MALLALALVACPSTSTSQIEAGEAVTTGKERFDSYFEAVRAFQDKVDAFDSDLFTVREPLTERLELDEDITLPELIRVIHKRAKKLHDYGVLLGLRLAPQPELLTAKGELEVDERDEADLKAIEESATRAWTVYRDFSELLARSAELEVDRAALAERLDKVPVDDPQRDVLETEIVGAGRVLDTAERKLRRDSRTLALYLLELVRVLDTGALAKRIEECDEALVKCKKKGPRKPWTGPVRPAKPAGDDFEM